ncbi:permease [Leucobacter sp. NPDC077196]|uniref:permease n=1 Tax=Leucobacter sp. NPDC077196 TaxID=3154959 RepID=UPI003433DC7D
MAAVANRSRTFALAGIAALTLVAAISLRAITDRAGDALALPAALADFVALSLSVFIESLPFVFLGILLSTVVQVWVPQSIIDRVLPRRPALRRAVLSVTGVLLPVCECGNVPLARGLMMRGFTVSEAATFLLAAPVLNPVTIITTYHAFGWSDGILAARIVGGFVIANLAGWLLSRSADQSALLTDGFRAHCEHQHDRHPDSRMQRSLVGIAEETSALMPALIIGSALAGAIQVGAPRDLLVALGSHPLWSVLALMLLAFIIAICSSVDAFFILSLSATFLPGSIVAFLLFGAMMDVKMLALLRTTFTARALALLTGLVALCCLVIGWGLNLVA